MIKEIPELSQSRNTTDNGKNSLSELTVNLTERVKELNCLYGVSRLYESSGLDLEKILYGLVNLIPPAWQYPEVTCACINLKNKYYQTNNFRKTIWQQAEVIKVNARKWGTLEVYYLKEKPDADEGPFLKEERALIHVLAQRAGNIIENRIAQDSIKSSYEREMRLRKKLQVEMQSRIDFNRKLMHELKTPLTSLMATSQLLTDEIHDEKLHKLAEYIWEGANRLNHRIDEMHDIVRGEIGSLKIKPEVVDIKQFVLSFVEETHPFLSQNGISINIEFKPSLPKVSADPERLWQIIYNLVNNACKYAAEGKRIDIRVDSDGTFVIIEVRDYGHGISKEKQRVLFKPGYQVSYRGEYPGGLGIGLTLCKMLVELHGGKIWVNSRHGAGARFFFTLPVIIEQKKKDSLRAKA